MAQARDHFGDLKAGQLPTFTGLSTLGNFDLNLTALVEILRRHTEATRSHLLHRAVGIVAIGERLIAFTVFTTFAGDGLGTNAVHRHVQGAVRLWAQGPQRHARRVKALADFVQALNAFQGNRLASCLEVQQVAQLDRRAPAQQADIFLISRV